MLCVFSVLVGQKVNVAVVSKGLLSGLFYVVSQQYDQLHLFALFVYFFITALCIIHVLCLLF